jgi:hypothetical protein
MGTAMFNTKLIGTGPDVVSRLRLVLPACAENR